MELIKMVPAHHINDSHGHEMEIDDHHGTREHGTSHAANETHDHDNSSDENCCEDDTDKFYANLVKHEVPVFSFDKISEAQVQTWSVIYDADFSFKELNPYTLNSALSPPVTGLYARILFQSFLC